MAIDWGRDLMLRHVRLFETERDGPNIASGYPAIREGWRDVVERLCARIGTTLEDGETFRFVQIVRKFGLLRIDWAGEVSEATKARIEEAVALAEARSSCTCEVCGLEGEKYYAAKFVIPRCMAHAPKDGRSRKRSAIPASTLAAS